MIQTERTCPLCGGAVSRNSQAVYCSDACKEKSRWRRRYANRTPEQVAADRESDRRRYANRTEGQRAADRLRWQSRDRKLQIEASRGKPFVAWDGEGRGNRYVLLANSEGRYRYNEEGLTTSQCLDFLLSADSRADAYNVFYSFAYDIANILRNLSREQLTELWTDGWTTYQAYEIRYAPRRFFGLSWRNQLSTYREFHDVFSLFGASFLETVDTWYPDIDPADLHTLEHGKAARGSLEDWTLSALAAYSQVECRALTVVMDRVRNAVLDSGLKTHSWYSAGPMAAGILKSVDASSRVGTIPPEMAEALESAYFGGRIESAAVGRSNCYHYDLVSAYPASYASLPDLSKLEWGRWSHAMPVPLRADEIDPYYLYDVSWDVPEQRFPDWYPLPFRRSDQVVTYPIAGRGWHWGVELQSAVRAYGEAPFVVHGGWYCVGERSYFLAPTVSDLAVKRLSLKAAGNPAHRILKLALNGISGKFAQRTLTRERPVPSGLGEYLNKPMQTPYRSLIWAGLVTAYTRARLLEAMAAVDFQVLSTMTDSIYSTVPLPAAMLGSGQGEWEQDAHCRSIALVEPGVYTLYDAKGQPIRSRSRGFADPTARDWWPVIRRWMDGDGTPERIQQHQAVTIGMALYQPEYAKKQGQFVESCREVPSPIHEMVMPKRLPGWLTGKREGDLWWLSSNSDLRATRDDETTVSHKYEAGGYRRGQMELGKEMDGE